MLAVYDTKRAHFSTQTVGRGGTQYLIVGVKIGVNACSDRQVLFLVTFFILHTLDAEEASDFIHGEGCQRLGRTPNDGATCCQFTRLTTHMREIRVRRGRRRQSVVAATNTVIISAAEHLLPVILVGSTIT